MKWILLPRYRRVLYEIVAVLRARPSLSCVRNGHACFGLCVCLGMVYMIKTCPDRPTSLLTAIVAGLIGIGTDSGDVAKAYGIGSRRNSNRSMATNI